MNDRDCRTEDTVDHVLRIEDACDRFEAAWRAGLSPRIEDYVADCKPDERLAILEELIGLDLHYRRADYRKRFPELPAAAAERTGFPMNDRYCFRTIHAKGGMGRVSVYYDREMRRRVALKELHAEQLSNAGSVRRFLQEAQITGRLEHPNVVPVYELVNTGPGRPPFYTMRFVSGRTLTEAIRSYHEKRRGGEAVGLELLTLLNAFVSICQTVAYAHSQGVVHRDLKGNNVVLGEYGEVIVLDWGLAKLLGQSEPEGDHADTELIGEDHTMQGVVKGTPGFLSPEQAAGRTDLIGPHTDVYGLGAILYEILAGQPPFSGTLTAEFLDRVINESPRPPSTIVSGVEPALETACLHALAKAPADRPASASDLAGQVQWWLAESAARIRARQERERFFDLTHDLLCTVGPDEKLQQVNQASIDQLGWSREELLTRPYLEFVHPDDRDRTRAGILEDLTRQTSIRNAPRDPSEYRLLRKDGQYRWISWRSSLIPGEDLVYAVGRDVTERRNAEVALRRSHERFELAVQASGVGIWDWNRETGESYYSPCWKSMIGYEDHEIAHTIDEWESRLHPDDRDRALAALRSCTEGTANEYQVEYRFRNKNGEYVWILDRGVVVRNETGVIRMAGSHTDITEQKKREQKLRERGSL